MRAARGWRFGGITVTHDSRFDGGGTFLAQHFVDVVRERHPQGVERVFEWGAGPGYIGFALLESGLCGELVLGEINSDAAALASRTVEHNGLSDRVRVYVSDSFRGVPAGERYDLVVANPPNYYAMDTDHPEWTVFGEELGPSDRGWETHGRFYTEVADRLRPGGRTYVSEVAIDDAIVPAEAELPLDVRPEAPRLTFHRMMMEGGLTPLEDIPIAEFDEGLGMWIMCAGLL